MKQTIVFDFDGVIHSYVSGWVGDAVIPDDPVEGIREAIKDIRNAGYEVVVVSTRSRSNEGMRAIDKWLEKHNIVVDRISADKPPAIVYIDDRAICFDGNPKSLLEKIKSFQPWYKVDNSETGKQKVNILGTDYDFVVDDDTMLSTNNDGMCKEYDKVILIRSRDNYLNPTDTDSVKELRMKEVKRHEIIHAFFHESGLDDYDRNEQLVDWISIQFPKLLEVFKQVDAI